ncbi:PQQ-binding-like beta-propeller repeat protein, partial [bacterium]|nr:PQQ-binding-like beta-propeller repeat protein [bacterium]
STPAVADGMVFVGCDSILGSNLFAFDEETGVEIWNAGVGLIGGASPVVYNDKVFIVVKEQNILSLKGDIKVVALDENNGTILWNKTILENVSSFEGLPKGLGLYYLMATSTPAVYETDQGVSLFISSPDGKLHALDITDGEKIWSIDLLSSAYDLIPIPCTSPVVAHDQVYVALANGIVHAVNMLGEKSWDFDCKTEDQGLFTFVPAIILSSPIVADGVLYVSATVTEDLETLGGRIYSIGNYTPNRRAKVISNPIHVSQSYWWNEFNAVCENINNTAGSTIKFSIFDANDNDKVLESNLNGTHNDISNIGSNVIRLCAEFERVNKSQDPTLHSWSVTWVSESKAPVFNDSSFTPNPPSGWINESRPTCSINVRDVADNDVISGLDISSAEYNLEYVPEGSNESITGSFKAKCDDANGVIETTLRAIISDLEINISELSITFSIKDLAGNEATSNPKTFKIDTVEPISNIKNISDFSDTYNESINITAEASDPGDPSVNKSGIKTVTLCYRYSIDDENWGDWEEFDTATSLFNWSFGNDTT